MQLTSQWTSIQSKIDGVQKEILELNRRKSAAAAEENVQQNFENKVVKLDASMEDYRQNIDILETWTNGFSSQ